MSSDWCSDLVADCILSVAAAAQWIANFVVSTTFPVLAATGLAFAYGIYALFALLSAWFVIRAVQETKGRELEDMQATPAARPRVIT